ncbi:hypothetical protein ACFWGI_35605 [Streptomyces niveus]|uniref:hypothetical protein n=1 Tax=Streptomyces niveus TaxID=193462 RepID=UPI0036668BCC
MPIPSASAGQFLQNALSRAGITSHPDGAGASYYIVVRVGGLGVIMIGGVTGGAMENKIHYRPSEHQGWEGVYYPDTENENGRFTGFYRSTNPDIAQDTADVVNAVRDIITGRALTG